MWYNIYMIKQIYFYDVTFHKKWEDSPETLVFLSEEEIDNIFTSLKKRSFVLWHKNTVISGIDDLGTLKVIKKDYFKYDENEKLYYKKVIVNKEWDVEEFEVSKGESEDVTNKLLAEYNIRWWYYERIWNVVLDWNTLYVDNFRVWRVEDWSKAQELLTLIIYSNKSTKEENLSYDFLKEVYKSWKFSFKTLQSYDITSRGIQDILWEKLRKVRNKKSIDFIDFSSKYIRLWNKK